LVSALNDFQPEWLHAYPSVAALLAAEQEAGRLRIAPRAVSTAGEVRTPEMTERMTAAWGDGPFQMYWMTEGGTGMECEHHRLHAIDDDVLMEFVDEDNRPVAAGETAHKVLVTNLYQRTQPMIRYEVTDMVTPSDEVCPCGRPFGVLSAVDGRSDDILHLADGRGGTVAVHPIALRSPFAAERGVRMYQVVERDQALTVKVETLGGVDRDALRERVSARLRAELESAGASDPRLAVEFVESIAGDAQQMDKLKLVRSESH
jgi:phenylacetate-coenzyme A ligase PaaK-like adenylate-forming protein